MILRSITTLISVSFLCLHSRLTLAQDTQGSPGQLTTRTQATSSQPVEVYVWGEQPVSTATEKTVRQKDLELRPTTTPSDILRLIPGLFIAQHQGGGKADQIFLRGFDADHGTDVAVFIDGIPVNFVSHGHGQGYADLHWLIPEMVDHVEVYKGPYFVQFGDFKTAGAVNIVTKRRDKDTTFTITGGSYNQQRYLERYEFLFSIANLANKKWRAAQFFHASRLKTEGTPVNDIHFTPGEPLTIKAGMTVHSW